MAAGVPSEPGGRPRVLLVDADPALQELLEQWLEEEGCSVLSAAAGHGSADLVIVDVPFPRSDSGGALRRVMTEQPGTPVLALSASFFPGIESDGAAARRLGVAGALAKPVTQGALLATVRRLLAA